MGSLKGSSKGSSIGSLWGSLKGSFMGSFENSLKGSRVLAIRVPCIGLMRWVSRQSLYSPLNRSSFVGYYRILSI